MKKEENQIGLFDKDDQTKPMSNQKENIIKGRVKVEFDEKEIINLE